MSEHALGQAKTRGFIRVSHVDARDPAACLRPSALQVKEQGREPVPVWDAAVARGGVTCCVPG